MTRMIFVGRKRADMARMEFIAYWSHLHAPLIRAIPGIRRYAIYPVMGFHSSAPVCDGLAELWFDSRPMLEDGLASKEGIHLVAALTRFCLPESGAVLVDDKEGLAATIAPAANRESDDARLTWENEGGAAMALRPEHCPPVLVHDGPSAHEHAPVTLVRNW